MTSDLSRLVRR